MYNCLLEQRIPFRLCYWLELVRVLNLIIRAMSINLGVSKNNHEQRCVRIADHEKVSRHIRCTVTFYANSCIGGEFEIEIYF